MRQQKFKIGDTVIVLSNATIWVLDNPDAFTMPNGKFDSNYKNAKKIALAAAKNETIKGKVVKVGAPDDNNDYFYGVQIDLPAKYFAFYDIKDLRKVYAT